MYILRKKEEAELFVKLTNVVRRKLRCYLEEDGWQGTEIADKFGFSSTRQTKTKDPKKYPDFRISKPLLRELLGRRFMSLEEILDGTDYTEKELEYLKHEYSVYKDPTLHRLLVAMYSEGMDPTPVLHEYWEKNRVKTK